MNYSFQPSFGTPCVFNPFDSGLTIEDTWPALYYGADRVEEMRRKIDTFDWARNALELWRAEAEVVLNETPAFTRDPDGGRAGNAGRCNMFSDAGHYRIFDAASRAPMWDPIAKRFDTPDEGAHGAWTVLQHERLRRLIVSMGFLHALTGDERFSRWAWNGLRDLIQMYTEVGAEYDVEAEPYRYVYGGLYEAQAQLLTVQALELLTGAPGGTADDVARLREVVITPGCEAISRWMNVMMVHNMSVWAMGALAQAGRALERKDWLEKALTSERCGLPMLLQTGMRRNEATGKPDGFWFEHSPFYGCFYVITAIIPLVRVGLDTGAMTDDLRERFAAFFEAPPHFTDSELRLLSISDRVAPGTMRLTQMCHLYEYAVGQVDAKHAPLLAMLYERCGAPRVGLAAMAYGPDDLPEQKPPRTLVESCALPEAGLATFRADTLQGKATLWFSNLSRYQGAAQGHHHMDKLSLSLHAFGDVITSDLGWPGCESEDSGRGAYLSGTFSHNTLMLDEFDQGTVEVQTFEADMAAAVPWARAGFRGNSSDKMWDTFQNHHGGRLKKGLYDDATITRTVWFDFPRIIVLDELSAESEKRFGFAFHARGSLVAQGVAAEGAALNMPVLPDDGFWQNFTGRASADPVSLFVADWCVRADIYLRLVTASDGSFDAHWGATPDNPAELSRGTVYLRAPGLRRRFATVLELHPGSPQVASVALSDDGAVECLSYGGDAVTYSLGSETR